MRPALLLLLLVPALLAAPLRALANHIDFISDGAFEALVTPIDQNGTATQLGDPANILGTERHVILQDASEGAFGAETSPSTTDDSDVTEILIRAAGSSFTDVTLLYDGVDSNGLGGIDFETSWDAISIAVGSILDRSLVTVTVSDGANSGSAALTVSAPGVYDFPFDAAGYVSNGVDFGSVESVAVRLEGLDRGAEIAIASITRELRGTGAPEPTAVMLLGLALAGLSLRRR